MISRADRRSAVAAAAYRAGQRLTDENDCRTGEVKTHDYRNRGGVVAHGVLLPPEALPALRDRQALWNAAEAAETRKNSRVAREAVIALPHELNDEQRHQVTRKFAVYLVKHYGVAADYAIHRPDKDADERNHHAHIMFTTRVMTAAGLGHKTRVLDDKHRGKEQIEHMRQTWERLCNEALAEASLTQRVDRRSLAARGIHRLPEPKQGAQATARSRRNQPSKAGAERQAVRAYNGVVMRCKADERRIQVKKDKATLRRLRREKKNVVQWLKAKTALIMKQLARKPLTGQLQQAWHHTNHGNDIQQGYDITAPQPQFAGYKLE